MVNSSLILVILGIIACGWFSWLIWFYLQPKPRQDDIAIRWGMRILRLYRWFKREVLHV